MTFIDSFFKHTEEPLVLTSDGKKFILNPPANRMLHGIQHKEGAMQTRPVFVVDEEILPYSDLITRLSAKKTVNGVWRLGSGNAFEVSFTYLGEDAEHEIVICIKQRVVAGEESDVKAAYVLDKVQFFLERFPVGVTVVDQNGKLIYANQAYERMWGLTTEEAKLEFDLRNNIQMEQLGLKRYIDRVLAGETVDFPIVYYEPKEEQRRRGVRPRWVKAFAVPLTPKNNEQLYSALIQFDLSDQKSFELDLLEVIKERDKDIRFQIENFVNYAEQSPDYIIRYDNEFRHLFVNRKVCEFLERPPDELIGKTYRDLGYPDEYVEFWEREIAKTITTKSSNRTKFDYLWITFDWILVPEFDEQGEVSSVLTVSRDITALVRAEKELLRSRDKLMDALKIANLATWEHDLINDYSILNERYCELLGIEFHSLPAPVTGTYFLEKFVHPRDREIVIEAFHKCRETSDPNYQDFIEFRVKSPKFRQYVLIYASVRVLIENEQVVRAYGTAQDITEFRKAEEELTDYRKNLEKMVNQRTRELKNSERKLQDALDIARLGTWEFDFSEKKFYVGAEVVEKMGTKYKLKRTTELTTGEFYNLLHPEDRWKFEQANEAAMQAHDEAYQDSFECRIVTDDKKVKNLFISIRIQLDVHGAHLKHYGTIQDITQIRKIEAERERLNSIIEATSDFVAIGKLNGKLLYLNNSARQFSGYSGDEFVERESIADLFTEESTKIIFEEALPTAIEKGIWKGNTTMIDKDGQRLPVSQVILSHKNSDGKPTSYSTIIRDISELKKIEQDLIFKNNELDTFVYSASHDLKGPIASLIGLNRLVKYEVTDKTALEYFDRYHSQVERLNGIVKTLLELAKIKETDAVNTAIDFKSIIDGCIQSFENFENFNRIRFHVQIDVKGKIRSDPNLIRTILQNLIENGIKYSRPIDKPYIEVRIKTSDNRQKLLIGVEDNGTGIHQEHQNKIFNMFFRAHEGGEGSGLGLYILKNAVEKLSGKIYLESKVNVGTTFTIELPLNNEHTT